MTYIGPATGMPDPMVLSTMTPELLGSSELTGGNGASAAWSAGVARFFPVRLSQPRTYVKVAWLNGTTVTGNVDVGIYTLSGTTMTRVVASTAEAQATVSVMQTAAAFTTTTIGPGLYYLALGASSTGHFWRFGVTVAMARSLGCYQMTAGHPLPSSGTVIAYTSASIPVFGLSELAAI